MPERKAKVVVLGGGTGLSVILRGLKKHPLDLTAIVTVADDGGSSGRLRDELEIPPPGDIRNVLIALAETEPLLEKLFQHRFTEGKELNGHSIGNLLLAAMTSISGDFAEGIKQISRVLNVKGRVLPAANHSISLSALMDDGTIIEGESTIPRANKRIKRLFLKTDYIEPLPESLEAVKEADLIIMGPGSLYTSVLPNLLVPKLGQEICRSKAKKIYICNVMTQQGETNHFTAGDHVQVLREHMGVNCLDAVLVNDEMPPEEILDRYALEGAEPVIYDQDKLTSYGLQVIHDKIIKYDKSVIRHDEERIAELLVKLLPDS